MQDCTREIFAYIINIKFNMYSVSFYVCNPFYYLKLFLTVCKYQHCYGRVINYYSKQ